MKTAITELIEGIEASQQRYIDLAKADKKLKKGVDAILTATTLIKMKANKLLEKEKQIIIDAVNNGVHYSSPEAYYNETFKND